MSYVLDDSLRKPNPTIDLFPKGASGQNPSDEAKKQEVQKKYFDFYDLFGLMKFLYRQDEMKNSILSQILEQDARARRKFSWN